MEHKCLVLMCVILWLSSVYSGNPLQDAYANIRCDRVGYTNTVNVQGCQPQSVKVTLN